jgi:uncharacterized protein YaeQ
MRQDGEKRRLAGRTVHRTIEPEDWKKSLEERVRMWITGQ